METSEKRDHVLENPRRYAGESEKLEDWKGTGQEWENTHTYQKRGSWDDLQTQPSIPSWRTGNIQHHRPGSYSFTSLSSQPANPQQAKLC